MAILALSLPHARTYSRDTTFSIHSIHHAIISRSLRVVGCLFSSRFFQSFFVWNRFVCRIFYLVAIVVRFIALISRCLVVQHNFYFWHERWTRVPTQLAKGTLGIFAINHISNRGTHRDRSEGANRSQSVIDCSTNRCEMEVEEGEALSSAPADRWLRWRPSEIITFTCMK